MQKFDYRYPRFNVDLPVRFTAQGSTVNARCKDISHDGMRLELAEPLPAGARGIVSLSHQGRTLQLGVRVANPANGGMVFLYESEGERKAVEQLVAHLATAPARQGPTLVSS
jgi:PilZ domain